MSATITSLTQDVITITKRGDLVADIPLHLKNALIKAHTADYWLRDMFETNFVFGAPAANYSLDYKSIIPRFRTIKYLTTIYPITGATVRILNNIPVEQFVDRYKYIKDYVYYVAGNNIKIRVSDSAINFGIGCFLYPDTTLATPSWIADEFPYAIVYEAVRTLFKVIGRDDESRAMESLLAEAMAEVRMVGITPTGE